jgi:hypothetical protein
VVATGNRLPCQYSYCAQSSSALQNSKGLVVLCYCTTLQADSTPKYPHAAAAGCTIAAQLPSQCCSLSKTVLPRIHAEPCKRQAPEHAFKSPQISPNQIAPKADSTSTSASTCTSASTSPSTTTRRASLEPQLLVPWPVLRSHLCRTHTTLEPQLLVPWPVLRSHLCRTHTTPTNCAGFPPRPPPTPRTQPRGLGYSCLCCCCNPVSRITLLGPLLPVPLQMLTLLLLQP